MRDSDYNDERFSDRDSYNACMFDERDGCLTEDCPEKTLDNNQNLFFYYPDTDSIFTDERQYEYDDYND
jgi:hypothetical protein